MKKPNLLKTVCILFVFCAATAIAATAQVLTTLYSFCSQANCTDGGSPYAGLVQATDGNFYGTTLAGGDSDSGTFFKITASGTLTTLDSFFGEDPYAALIQATDGNFYGTSYEGGGYGAGTAFQITPAGRLTTLYNFCSQGYCSDGQWPRGGLVQATDGNFYGTTSNGGVPPADLGTVFKITASGTLTTLYLFDGNNGESPYGTLVQAGDGNFYGTTFEGGHNGFAGTVFGMTPSGTVTMRYDFCTDGGPCTDGENPYAGLVQATDGNFYGTTAFGGTSGNCYGPFGPSGCGTVFKITPAGTLTTLHSFCSQTGCPDGSQPYAPLVQGRDGNFYGTTSAGGARSNCLAAAGCGTVFKITPSGILTTLHSFHQTDGAYPYGALVQASDGSFYGTTSGGGANGYGTVFRLMNVRACIVCRAVE